jgi:hypothetical protein
MADDLFAKVEVKGAFNEELLCRIDGVENNSNVGDLKKELSTRHPKRGHHSVQGWTYPGRFTINE